ncbi:MAG: hypothetical protein L0271_07350 [Gemmatimonadetes bacterium]|nr:hypothetical protein [Gemmatimonadota bacterium]
MSKRAIQLAAVCSIVVGAGFMMGQSCVGPAAPASHAGPPDSDGDLVPDYLDNCRLEANRSQLQTGPVGLERCAGAVPEIDDNNPQLTYGTCDNDPGRECLIDRDCRRGNRCDCDFDGDGGCDIDDFNLFLADYATGVNAHGTDMNADGAVDDADFAIFEPLFAQGAPGAGSSTAKVAAADASGAFQPGACFDGRQGRRLWASEGRSDGVDILDCSVVIPTVVVGLGIGLGVDEITAMATNKNNPTNALQEILTGIPNQCPNAAFSIGSKLEPRACDLHDLCLDRCGTKVDDCNRQFYRDLFNTCAALSGPEAICQVACNRFATIYASFIARAPILSPPADPSSSPPSDNDLQRDAGNCQCGPPVCESDADCLNQITPPNGSVCELGYCIHIHSRACPQHPCAAGYRCDTANEQCRWDVTALPDRLGAPPPVCGDGLCESPVETCAATSCPEDCGVAGAPVDPDKGRCGLLDACAQDQDCAEGACLFGQCRRLPDDSVCNAPSDCLSDSCDFLTRHCKSGCLVDADCGTGVCSILGQCIAPQPNGSACDANSDCASGVCNFPVCIAANSVSPGSACTTDAACTSGRCVAGLCGGSCGDGFCTVLPDGETCFAAGCQTDCGKCGNTSPCTLDADCASNFCRLGFCFASGTLNPGSPCLFNQECTSGFCNAGFCDGVCGDGFCTLVPDGETCFANSCQSDCGKCGLGTPCTLNADCASGLCVLVCVNPPTCASNGTACLLDSACCSGRCDFFSCQACLGAGNVCDESSDCCSGNCRDNGFLQPRTCT